jgi:hypothetical protein
VWITTSTDSGILKGWFIKCEKGTRGCPSILP